MSETDSRQKHIQQVQLWVLSPWRRRLAMLAKLPMAFFAGLRPLELTSQSCKVEVPYRWMNKNPFRSTFWAVLGMAAEFSSGALAILHTFGCKPSVATIVTGCTAQFHKKATGPTVFHCDCGDVILAAVEKTLETGEGVEVLCPVKGVNADGELIAEFTFTWSFKARKK